MAKGGNWERDVCKFLSKWVSGHEKPYIFWRTGGSGGVFTVSEGKAGEYFSGDICAIREEGKFLTEKFSIECKTGYKEASFDKHFKYNKSDPFKSFWIQVVNDSQKANKYPMLIFRKKGMTTPWVCIGKDVYDIISLYLYDIRRLHICWRNLPETVIFEYKEFFERIKPEIIEEDINGKN